MSLRDKQAIPISSAALSALSSFQRRKKREAILNHPPNSGKSLEISSLNCWRAELRERSFISTITLWKVHIIALPACLENKAADQPALLLLSPSVFTLEQLTSFSSLLFSSLLSTAFRFREYNCIVSVRCAEMFTRQRRLCLFLSPFR